MRPAQVHQPAVAHQQQNEDSPDQVVNVAAAHHHPLEGPHIVHDQADQDAGADKGKQKRRRGHEHALPGTVGDGRADQIAKPGQLQQDQQQDDHQAGKGQQ